MLAVASQMLDEIIVCSQLYVYHPSVAVCWTETDIKGGCVHFLFCSVTIKVKIKEGSSLVHVWGGD